MLYGPRDKQPELPIDQGRRMWQAREDSEEYEGDGDDPENDWDREENPWDDEDDYDEEWEDEGDYDDDAYEDDLDYD